jgi:hypothetical protein
MNYALNRATYLATIYTMTREDCLKELSTLPAAAVVHFCQELVSNEPDFHQRAMKLTVLANRLVAIERESPGRGKRELE